jgi:hypothetical protein
MAPTPKLTDAPLGQPALPGSLQPCADGCDLVAAGSDIWLEADEGHFGFFAHEGDFELCVRVEAFAASHLYAKAGLMVRESLAPGSRHIFLLTFRNDAPRNNNNGGFEGQYRAIHDGPCTGLYPPQPDPAPSRFPACFPHAWLRIARRGDAFHLFQGVDGTTWKAYGAVNLALAPRLLLGVAATSHDPATTATARFRELSVSV